MPKKSLIQFVKCKKMIPFNFDHFSNFYSMLVSMFDLFQKRFNDTVAYVLKFLGSDAVEIAKRGSVISFIAILCVSLGFCKWRVYLKDNGSFLKGNLIESQR